MARFTSKPFLPFQQARQIARDLSLKSVKEWRQYMKAHPLDNVPAAPDGRYVKEWQGWGDWLGTGNIAAKNKVFRSYSEACRWVRENGIKSEKQWLEAVKAGQVPADIPRSPRHNYKDEWTTSGDFFGTGFVAYTRRSWVSFEEAKLWASTHGITCREDWIAASKAGVLPKNIPAGPIRVYKECAGGWAALFDKAVRGGSSFIEEVIAHELMAFLPVDRSIRTISLGKGRRKRIDIAVPTKKLLIEYDGWHWHRTTVVKDQRETRSLVKQGWRVVRLRESPLSKISTDDCVVSPKKSIHQRVVVLLRHLLDLGLIPATKEGLIDDYATIGKLQTAGTVLAHAGSWADFATAQAWARHAGVKSSSEFRRYAQENGLPDNIPSVPEIVYQADWPGWGEFLGTGRSYGKPGSWRSFKSARAWAAKSGINDYKGWQKAIKENRIPNDIPRRPHGVYKTEWISYAHWFGANVKKGQRREWRLFKDAREWARASGAKSEADWRLLVKRPHFPRDVPKVPPVTYRDAWKGWGDWLGTGTIAPQQIAFLPFLDARRLVRSLGLRTETEWRTYKASHSLPPGVPRKPEHVYSDSGWHGFRDWLLDEHG